jgi:hypothetical protein
MFDTLAICFLASLGLRLLTGTWPHEKLRFLLAHLALRRGWVKAAMWLFHGRKNRR